MKVFFTKLSDWGLFKIPLLLLCLSFSGQVLAQAVSGKVTDSATGESLIGATS
jgi:hypothetical protein